MLKLPQGTEKCYFRCNPSSLCRLDPEEWVRQHCPLSSAHKGYPQALMANEAGTAERYKETLVIQCSIDATLPPDDCGIQGAPEIEITQKVFDQITRQTWC